MRRTPLVDDYISANGHKLAKSMIDALVLRVQKDFAINVTADELVAMIAKANLDDCLSDYEYPDTLEREVVFDAVSIYFTGLHCPCFGQRDIQIEGIPYSYYLANKIGEWNAKKAEQTPTDTQLSSESDIKPHVGMMLRK